VADNVGVAQAQGLVAVAQDHFFGLNVADEVELTTDRDQTILVSAVGLSHIVAQKRNLSHDNSSIIDSKL
jgi:hypothetical protein